MLAMVVGVFVCSLLVSCGQHDGSATTKSTGAATPESFVTMFQEAQKSGKLEKIKELCCWDGIPDQKVAEILARWQPVLDGELKEVKYVEIPEKDRKRHLRPVKVGGVTYVPNTGEIVAELRYTLVEKGRKKQKRDLVGRKSGRYFFPINREE